ncbi:hypothetical protein [Afipia carboxidovorans]|uniref:hypothetical protein n=1 Tax=Afipia carboxidovorans TaxID=40137 RepID=UPI00308970FC|nr:hypothetical protein CRBSH125_09370 [Afipia carboxidovorans]
MRIAVTAAALALVCLSLPAEARPRHMAHHRYAPECNVSMPCEGVSGVRKFRTAQATDLTHGFVLLRENPAIDPREARRRARGQALYNAMPFGMPTDRAGRALPASQVIGGRPAGCPHRFCGCGASLHLFGKIIPRLNLAANWLRFPRAAPAPNMAAARRGHVMVLKRHLHGSVWLVHDSNSGGGKTRLHARSIAGFVIVDPSGAG